MECSHASTAGEMTSSGTGDGRTSEDGNDEVFATIGQHVHDLNIKERDGHGAENELKDDPEEFRWGDQKVVETVESLCMNCQENVGFLPTQTVRQRIGRQSRATLWTKWWTRCTNN